MPARRVPLIAVILAAGQGTRMRSKTIKLLHPVAGRPMVAQVLDTVSGLRPARVVTVVGYQQDHVRLALAETGCDFVLQKQQLGTGHAVRQAVAQIRPSSSATLLILNGDLPTLRRSTLSRLVAAHRRSRAALTLLSTRLGDPTGYGRVVRDKAAVARIVEHRDASAAERRVDEVNVGIYVASAASLVPALRRLRRNNAQGEYYITDAVHDLIRRGAKVQAVCHPDTDEVLGVNDRAELARASLTLYERKATELLARGVTLLDPARTRIDPRAKIGRDSVIHPDVTIEGASVLGEDCVVRSGSRITGCKLGRGVVVLDHCVLTDSRVGNAARIGPFAHLRPGSDLEAETKVGNFVELKNTRLGRGSKASHLSYLGDATIGRDCNIGAGTITCNYDGKKKYTTELGPGVFVGSDTQLVAPVKIRAGAYVAAGTTVTADVPAGALAIGRTRQRNVTGWVERRRKKQG